jgi:hypothetical protein
MASGIRLDHSLTSPAPIRSIGIALIVGPKLQLPAQALVVNGVSSKNELPERLKDFSWCDLIEKHKKRGAAR